MKRRALLRRAGVVGTAVIAGCRGNGSEPGETPTDDEPRTDETPTDDGDQEQYVTDTEFTVTDRSSGIRVSEATVSFDGDTVGVEGTIWGSDGCKTAVLTDASYDAAADELTVAVGTKDREDAGDACTQAIVEIEYRAAVTVDDGPPGTVVVTHDTGEGPEEVARERPTE